MIQKFQKLIQDSKKFLYTVKGGYNELYIHIYVIVICFNNYRNQNGIYHNLTNRNNISHISRNIILFIFTPVHFQHWAEHD